MLTITIKANAPAADAQGIKERIAMDIERYGDCKETAEKIALRNDLMAKAHSVEELKAELDASKAASKLLNDQGQEYWRAWQASKREVADLKNKLNDAEQRADYAERHPWRNLRAWLKRKMVRHE